MQLLEFTKDMQQQVIQFLEKCFVALGWGYSPNGRHIDTADIEKQYMQNGCFWCLFDNQVLIGTVAVQTNITQYALIHEKSLLQRSICIKNMDSNKLKNIITMNMLTFILS